MQLNLNKISRNNRPGTLYVEEIRLSLRHLRRLSTTDYGFTLIELLITLIIIAILTTIAYPAYLDHLTRARRIDGKTALLDLANRMENYYTDHETYQTATISALKSNKLSAEAWYTLSIASQTESSYTLYATARGTQARDNPCAVMSLNSQGVKSEKNCWS